jgi:hypothetical protein
MNLQKLTSILYQGHPWLQPSTFLGRPAIQPSDESITSMLVPDSGNYEGPLFNAITGICDSSMITPWFSNRSCPETINKDFAAAVRTYNHQHQQEYRGEQRAIRAQPPHSVKYTSSSTLSGRIRASPVPHSKATAAIQGAGFGVLHSVRLCVVRESWLAVKARWIMRKERRTSAGRGSLHVLTPGVEDVSEGVLAEEINHVSVVKAPGVHSSLPANLAH